MVHKTSKRHLQAVMNNRKFIILEYLPTKKSGILDWHRFLHLVCKQSLCLEGNALQTSYQVQCTQG